jgi:hypothetical protein
VSIQGPSNSSSKSIVQPLISSTRTIDKHTQNSCLSTPPWHHGKVPQVRSYSIGGKERKIEDVNSEEADPQQTFWHPHQAVATLSTFFQLSFR